MPPTAGAWAKKNRVPPAGRRRAAVGEEVPLEVAALQAARSIVSDSPSADRGLATVRAIGVDHLTGRVLKQRPGLIDRRGARDHRRPFGELGHRPAVLVA
jgi:hypothetical protein